MQGEEGVPTAERQNDFSRGSIPRNILMLAGPMTAAQLINILYNIVDRMYLGRLPGHLALTGLGLCLPIISILMGFANLCGMGGAPLCSICRGRGEEEEAERVMGNSFTLLLLVGAVLTVVILLFKKPILYLFGASPDTFPYADAYLTIYALGTLFVMVGLGMNPFINAQGYSSIGMLSVAIGAGTNLVLDPLFIFALGLGVRGAAIATVISQCLSAAFVLFFLTKKSELKLRFLHKNEIPECTGHAKNILSLGAAGFIMQLTNSLVTICCNNILSVTGGDIYISVMTIISSVRQLVENPIHAMVDGTSPILSYNYGARRPGRVRKSILIMSLLVFGYTTVMWSMIILIPETLIRIFSSDAALIQDAVPALNMYFAAFIFMDLQYIGQAVFKSLNKKVFAIFFSLLRKVFIVVPLTYFLPYTMHMGTDGVFLAEPVSNVIGGTACILTMLITIMPELKRIEVENHRTA